MTACVNRKHTKKVAAVVTASLVGALSLGVAPVAAVADTGIETLAAGWYTGATVTAATDGQGGTVSDPAKATFTVGSDRYLKPVQIKNSLGDTTDLDTDGYVYKYYKNNSGTWNLVAASDGSTTRVSAYFSSAAATADTYRVTVTKKGSTTEVAGPFAFKLTNASTDVTYSVKGSVVYNGENQMGSIDFVDQDGNDAGTPVSWNYADGSAATSVTNAGTYYATFANGEVVTVAVQPLDLSSATVNIPDLKAGMGGHSGDYWNADILAKAEINGSPIASTLIDGAGSDDILKISSRSDVSGYDSGVNTVTISGTSSAVNSGNVKGSATVAFTIYDEKVADVVRYGRADAGAAGVDIYLEDGDAFDASKIKVEKVDNSTSPATVEATYAGDQIEVSYAKKDGSSWVACDAAALAEPGIYKVYVRVVPFQDFASNDWMGGSIDFQVTVTPTSINANKTMGFYFDGELAGKGTKVAYDGTNQLDKLEIVVKNAEGETMVEGTDYDVVVKKNGKKVTEVVDADSSNPYTVTVEAKTFSFTNASDAEFDITVVPVKVDTLKDATDVSYTGSAIEVPAVSYLVKDINGNVVEDEDGNDVYATLPSELYNVVSIKKGGKTVKEIKDAGTYTVTIALVEGAADNYALTDTKFDVTVKEFGHFADVQPNAWYAQSVEKAYKNWYINGISGTNLYAPEADITRADAVCILFNMAGGFSMSDDDFSYSETYGYDTGFNDVDGHAYFAKALAWAHAAGIANGSEGNFRPYDQITREEFASLLANFAKNKGEFTVASDDALAGMSDANTVSDWAADNVAWAVENGVMGNGGFVAGQDNITRAEVAAMAVNYQPKVLDGVKLPTDSAGNLLR